MSSDKLENIYKLLIEHNFDSNKNVPNKFKCGKCRKLLIEACQTRCGCRFCRSCVDEMMNNGCQFCPGITNDCKIELLSSVVIDYRANKQISELIMNCPEEMCSYECELLEMSEHLRICGKKSVECPFYKLGCDWRKMTNEKLIEHFQLENFNHNKTLIDMIDNIKNEVEELREKELRNHQEINKLKMEMEKRLENIEKMFNIKIDKMKSEHEKEMKSMKKDKEELDNQLQIGLRNIWYKIDEIELELKKRYENGKIESIKSKLIKKIEILQTNFDDKIDDVESKNKKEIKSINNDIRLEMMEVCKQTVDESLMQIGIEQKINQLERIVENKMNGIFEMMIDNVNQWRNKYFCSEYFYARMHPYKLRLSIYPFDDELSFHLCLCDDAMNQYLPFPFKADVTIKIINKNQREMSRSLIKYCQIEKPKNTSDIESDEFIFSFSELTKNGILEFNCLIVQCRVELR